MKMPHKIIMSLLFVGMAVSIGGFLYTRHIANAYDLGDIVIEPATPNPQPEASETPADDRIARLPDRGDGARLVATAEDGETFLRLAFADNATLIVSATSTEDGEELRRIFTLALEGGRATIAESNQYLSASSHRPTHANAGTTCFSKEDERARIDIWCRKRGSTEDARLTEHDGNEVLTEAAISPGGDWAAFQVNDTSKKIPAGGTIWKIGMNRSGIQQLTRGADDRYPTWSLDGKTLYFQRRLSDGNWDVYRMTASGANPEPILRTYDDDEMWPAEVGENRIILVSGPRGKSSRLRILDIESKSSVWLTSGAFGSETVPTVSPDGRLISFLAPVNLDEPRRLGIWVTEIRE